MATYKYKGLSASGQEVEGIVKALDVTAASVEIRKSVDVIQSIKPVGENANVFENLFKEKVNIKQLALVCRQFSIILHAGLPIATSIRLIANNTEDKHLKQLLLDVCDDVTAGSSVADAFEFRDPTLPTAFIETIRAGEESGKLDIAFDRLSTFFTKKASTNSKVVGALIYPIIVIVIAIIVVAVLMIFAVPMFTESFEALGTELPWVTKALINMSDFFVNYYWVIVAIFVIALIVYRVYTNTDEGKYNFDRFRLHIPVLGKIRMMSSASEFATTFATMLASGIPAIKALTITGRSITNYAISKQVLESVALVEGGYKIGDSLKQETELPDLLLEVTGVGESSGSLESTLNVISEFYDDEVDQATRNALAILEPATIIVLAVIVLFILLAVYLPMFSMYDTLG